MQLGDYGSGYRTFAEWMEQLVSRPVTPGEALALCPVRLKSDCRLAPPDEWFEALPPQPRTDPKP